MAAPRATLLAAVVVAAGSAAPLFAQSNGSPADRSVNVLPPRPLQLQSLPIAPLAGPVQSAAFRSAGTVQRMPAGDAAGGSQSRWLSAPADASGAAQPP